MLNKTRFVYPRICPPRFIDRAFKHILYISYYPHKSSFIYHSFCHSFLIIPLISRFALFTYNHTINLLNGPLILHHTMPYQTYQIFLDIYNNSKQKIPPAKKPSPPTEKTQFYSFNYIFHFFP